MDLTELGVRAHRVVAGVAYELLACLEDTFPEGLVDRCASIYVKLKMHGCV